MGTLRHATARYGTLRHAIRADSHNFPHLSTVWPIEYDGQIMGYLNGTNSAASVAFRANVRAALEAKALSITSMAVSLQMSRAALSRVLCGHQSLTLIRAERIAGYLDLPLSDLVAVEDFANTS